MVEILQCNFERPMAVKTIKEKKSVTKKSNFDAAEKVSKTSSKKKVVDEDDDLDEEEDVDDDWGKEEEEEDDSWDPDFEEFDMPKKATKKAGKGKKGSDEDDDFGLEEDLNLEDDLFDDKDEFDDDF
jgi:nucleolin